MEQQMDILERIHASYYQLTAAERKIADYVLAHHQQVQFMSITQLAEECGTADATVSRFCRNLKLKGFNAFKLEIAKRSAAASAAAGSHPIADAQTSQGRRHEVGRLSHEAVSQTIELLDYAAVEKAVALFEGANRVLCAGSGGSSIMASDCCHQFSTVSNKFFSVADTHMQMSAVATMTPGDVIILFSYSGATTAGLQLLEQANARGLHTVLVTRYQKSPAARLSEVVLLSGANETPVQQGSVYAKIAQLVVMGVLFQEYYHRNRDSSDAYLQNIATAMSGMHV